MILVYILVLTSSPGGMATLPPIRAWFRRSERGLSFPGMDLSEVHFGQLQREAKDWLVRDISTKEIPVDRGGEGEDLLRSILVWNYVLLDELHMGFG